MNNKPKEMVSLDIDELGVVEWALEEGLKKLDKKIDERMSLIRLSKTVRTGARILVDESDSILNVDTRSEDGNPKSQLIALLEDPEIGGIFIGKGASLGRGEHGAGALGIRPARERGRDRDKH